MGRTLAETTAERVQNPECRDGYELFAPDLAIHIDVSLAKPATVLVLVICRMPDGCDRLGNYGVRQHSPAGRHQRAWTVADLTVEGGAPIAAANGVRIVSAVVCAWNQPVGLVVHRVTVGNAGSISRP